MQSSGRVALQALALDMMTAYLHAVSDTIDLHCVETVLQIIIYVRSNIPVFLGPICPMNLSTSLDLL